MHWMGPSPSDHPPFRDRDGRDRLVSPLESFGRLSPRIGGVGCVERDQSLEIGSLARFLGLRESDLPCLILTLLHPILDQDACRISIPLEQILESTFYTYVKSLVERLDGLFAEATEITRRRAGLGRDLTEAERRADVAGKALRRREEARRMVKLYAREGLPQAAACALSSILNLTQQQQYGAKERTECVEALAIIRQAQGDKWQRLTPELRRLIDLSTRVAEVAEILGRANLEVLELRKSIERAESEQDEQWQRLKLRFQELAARKDPPSASLAWDFFIAYSSADHDVAERVFQVLSSLGRVFLDSRCLLPGDRWPERVRSAQDQSTCTIAILTKNTPSGWYVESEHLRAIELVRKRGHTLIPLLFGEGAQLPYGMEQVQAVRLSKWSELGQLPALVKRVGDAQPSGGLPGGNPDAAGE
jgi:hypothetical protein